MTRLSPVLLLIATATVALAQTAPLEDGGLRTQCCPGHAGNIAKEADAEPGYGFVAKPDETDWVHAVVKSGADTYTSDRQASSQFEAQSALLTAKPRFQGSSRRPRNARSITWFTASDNWQ